MFTTLLNHFRLSGRLLFDRRVSFWLKAFMIGLPVIYYVIPLPDDLIPIPLLGIADDAIFVGLLTLIFNAMCPRTLVAEHRQILWKSALAPAFNLDAYRFPTESRDLAIGFAFTFGLLAVFGYLAGLLGLLLLGIGYITSRIARGNILANAVQISQQQLPDLNQALTEAQKRLPPVKVHLFVTQNPLMNAFTFGFDEPYSIVLTSGLVEKMNASEIRAVIGHELGHIVFEHVRLTTLMGGLGGWLRLLFYQWRRSCEYSADALALVACDGNLTPVVSTMLKLGSGLTNVPIDVQAFLDQLDDASGREASMAEKLSTHPFLVNRVRRLKQLAAAGSKA